MRFAITVVGLLLATPAGALPEGLREYAIDSGHSLVEFSIGFLHTNVRGRFDGKRGTIFFDAQQPERSSVTVVLESRSVDTGSDHRDEHLRSDDFFDVERYPAIRFQSREVKRHDDGLLLIGSLSLHGTTRDVRIPVRVVQPPTQDPHGSTIVNFAGALRIARRDYGILGGSRHNEWFDALRSATMADSVDITLEIEAWATDFDRQVDPRLEQGVARVGAIGVDSLARALRARAAADPKSLQGQEWGIDQLGRALFVRHREAEGMKLLQLNAELFPRSAAANVSLAWCWDASGKRPEALAACARALQCDPDDPRAQEWKRRLAP
jgi:polyisoprenoid-binding protein YceI